MPRVVTKGAPPLPDGTIPHRIEIREFVKSDYQLSLLVQALTEMYKTDQGTNVSYFRIGGIHGMPYEEWSQNESKTSPKADSDADAKSEQWDGYCTHASVLFPAWHRPYVVLYEQILQEHASAIAKKYPFSVRAKWELEAAKFRVPYWNWAINSVPPDVVISDEFDSIKVATPDGPKDFKNPLRAYGFHPIPPQFKENFAIWGNTLRHPKQVDDPKTGGKKWVSDVEDLKEKLSADQKSIRNKTYRLLIIPQPWEKFSNRSGEHGDAPNIESIHDDIHVKIGWGGHMNYPPYAGFDPIFYFHHSNVDHVLACWQTLHPNIWVTPGPAHRGTRTIKADTTVDEKTNLTPFANDPDAETFWTSSDLSQWAKLGYTYPDLQASMIKGDKEATRRALAHRIEEMYGSPVLKRPATSSTDSGQENPIRDWAIRIRFKPFEIGRSFSVLIFLGPVPENPTQWFTTPSYVGSASAFVNTTPEHCQNCMNRLDETATDLVYLDEHISENNPELGTFKADVIVPYLKEKFSYRILKDDGTILTSADVKSLKLMAIAVPMSWTEGAIFATPGEAEQYPEITGELAG